MKSIRYFVLLGTALALAVPGVPSYASRSDGGRVNTDNNRQAVRGERPAGTSDAWLGMKVKTMLLVHRNVSALHTDVDVKNGVVTLRGEAESLAQKDLTSEYAKDVEGVREVRNEMTVAMIPEKERESVRDLIGDASITGQIKLALLFHRSTSALATNVETTKGVVTLRGKAANAAEKDLVTELVTDIDGVKRVENRMTVATSG